MTKFSFRSINNLFSKVLLAILLLSFVLWGIGDIFTKNKNAAVIQVGDAKISYGIWKSAMERQVASLAQRTGKTFTLEELKEIKFGDLLAEQMVKRLLLLQEAKSNGLKISDDIIAMELNRVPEFQDEDGKFSKEKLLKMIEYSKLSEQEFFAVFKDDVLVNSFQEAILANKLPPDLILTHLVKALAVKRHVEFITIPTSSVKVSKVPSEAELTEVYNTNKNFFSIPETRDVTVLKVDSDAQAALGTVAEDTIRRYYEENQERFKVPEARSVSQIVFGSVAEANLAFTKIRDGEEFSEVAKSASKSNKVQTSLGAIKYDDLPESLASEVFRLQVNEITSPIETPLGWHIFKVNSIIPENTKSFAAVKDEIKGILEEEKSLEKIAQLMKEIEKKIASGANLEDIANQYKFKLMTIKNLDNKGDNLPAAMAELKDVPEFLNTAFNTSDGMISAPLFAGSKAYILSVTKITPARVKDIAEVKDKVVGLWQDKEIAIEMTKKSQELIKAAGAAKLSEVASKFGLPIADLWFASNGWRNKDLLPVEFLQRLKNAKLNGGIESYRLENGDYIIAKVVEVLLNDKIDNASNNIESYKPDFYLSQEYEVLAQYLQLLKGKYKIKMNDEIIKRII